MSLSLLGPGRILALLAATVLAFAVIACASDDDDDPAPTATTAPPAEATSPPEPTAPAETPSEPEGDGDPTLEISLAEGGLGAHLVGPDGMTLYIFLQDGPNTTNCEGNCLEIWPPLLLEAGQTIEAGPGIDGAFDTIEMSEGTMVTYREAPLYYFVPDQAPGDTEGHLVGDVWFVARPDTASTSTIGVSGAGDDAYLVGPTGMSLYFFANDTEGVSNCTDQCLEIWPALTTPEGLDPSAVAAAGGELGVLTREDDGTRHVTYNGMPLYYYAGDSLPGDTTGDGVGDVWDLATP